MGQSGFVIKEPQVRSVTAFVTDRHLGLNADKTRVVDYYSTEAAFNFRSPGKPVSVEEAERYRISAENPFTPKDEPAAAAKAAPAPENKAVSGAQVENKGATRGKRR